MVINLLVKDGYLKSVLECVRDEELAKRVYMTCFYVKDFPPKDLLEIKSIIRQLFDSVEFEDEKMQLTGDRMEIGFLTILSSLIKSKKSLSI